MSRQTQLAKNRPSCTAPLPPHGLYRRYPELPLLSRLTLKTETGENYFVKLVDVTSQMSKMDFFAHGGAILSANVPVGTFTVKYADGLVWCGEDELFGPDTLFQESERAFDFGVGNEWTIELVRRRGGNLRTRYIKRSEF